MQIFNQNLSWKRKKTNILILRNIKLKQNINIILYIAKLDILKSATIIIISY